MTVSCISTLYDPFVLSDLFVGYSNLTVSHNIPVRLPIILFALLAVLETDCLVALTIFPQGTNILSLH